MQSLHIAGMPRLVVKAVFVKQISQSFFIIYLPPYTLSKLVMVIRPLYSLQKPQILVSLE